MENLSYAYLFAGPGSRGGESYPLKELEEKKPPAGADGKGENFELKYVIKTGGGFAECEATQQGCSRYVLHAKR
jgi:hypothetical protein